jgi:hypothetical protein
MVGKMRSRRSRVGGDNSSLHKHFGSLRKYIASNDYNVVDFSNF